MKKAAKRILTLCLMLMVLGAVIGVGAFADSMDLVVSMNVGVSYSGYLLEGENNGDGGTFGLLPEGVSEIIDQGGYGLKGTPTTAGSYSFSHTMLDYNGGADMILNVTVNVGKAAAPKVTKSPTDETVNVGGACMFIARADNARSIKWRLTSPDGKTTYTCSEAVKNFPGLGVDGDGTDTLTLTGIPIEVNGWTVDAEFASWNSGESPAYSNSAKVGVLPKPPVISSNPSALNLTVGQSGTISVSANDPNNGTLKYQWYSNSTATNVGGVKVNGANSATFNPPQTVGTVYYYVAVTSTKDNSVSDPAYSTAAAVTFTAAATPTPAPTATPLPDPGNASGDPASDVDVTNASPTAAPTPVQPSAAPSAAQERRNSGNSFLTVILIILVVALIGSAVALFITAKKEKAEQLAELEEEPEFPVRPACKNCGWECEDPTSIPKFCPNCGKPFGKAGK